SAEQFRLWPGNERPGDRLHHSASGQNTARPACPALPFRQNGARHAMNAWHRRRRNVIQPDDADDFLNDVRRAVDVRPPAWPGDFHLLALAVHLEAQIRENTAALVILHGHAGQTFDALEIE